MQIKSVLEKITAKKHQEMQTKETDGWKRYLYMYVSTLPRTELLGSGPVEPDTQPWGSWSDGRQKPLLELDPYRTPPKGGKDLLKSTVALDVL